MPRNIPRVNAASGSVPHIYTKGDIPYYLVLPAGLRGSGPALAGRLGVGGAFALCARGSGDRLQCSLRPDSAAASCGVGCGVGPSLLHKRGHSLLSYPPCLRSAESVLRSQEGSGKEGLSRFARGMGLIAFNARSGPVPLPLRSGLLNRRRWFWGRLWKVGWIVDVRYGMKRTPNTGVVVASHELGSESKNPTLRSAAFGSPSP